MARAVLIATVSRRRQSAGAVQKVLTEFGCLIRTRLGIHAGVGDACTDDGLIILELVGQKKEMALLSGRLRRIAGVTVRIVPVGR